MSLVSSCSWRLIVCVEMTTRRRRRFVVARLFGFSPVAKNGRHEIGEALAHAGAGLDDQVMAILDRVGHGIGHGQLFVAMFVVRQPCGDPPRRPEDFGRRKHPLSVAGERRKGEGGRGNRPVFCRFAGYDIIQR